MGNRQVALDMFNQAVNVINAKALPSFQQEAYKLFASSCYADPTFPEAFYQSGNNNTDLNLSHSAIACYRRALECNPPPSLRASILCNLGWQLHSTQKTVEALEVSLEALRLANLHNRDVLPSIYINLSCIYGLNKSLIVAEEHARKAFELDPKNPQNEMALAFALLFNRKFAEGFKHFERRFEYKLKEYLQYPYPKWSGEPGKTIYLCADQGLGDTISFARFVRQTCKISKYVHARIQPNLMRLFQHAFVDIPNLNLIPQPCPFPVADAWTTFVSLPHNLNLTDEEIRNASHIDCPVISKYPGWRVSDRKFHIGIAWGGSPLNDIDKHRNIPVQYFLELFRVPGVQLYSLQVGDRAKDMHDSLGAGPVIADLSTYIGDVADTVGFIRQLDLVISVESALPHICALAGKECWIPYAWYGRDYRLGASADDMIWTPKHRVFQQDSSGTWEPVFKRIVEALQERVNVK